MIKTKISLVAWSFAVLGMAVPVRASTLKELQPESVSVLNAVSHCPRELEDAFQGADYVASAELALPRGSQTSYYSINFAKGGFLPGPAPTLVATLRIAETRQVDVIPIPDKPTTVTWKCSVIRK